MAGGPGDSGSGSERSGRILVTTGGVGSDVSAMARIIPASKSYRPCTQMLLIRHKSLVMYEKASVTCYSPVSASDISLTTLQGHEQQPGAASACGGRRAGYGRLARDRRRSRRL